METKDLDVVYVVKEGAWNEELRYSLRSLKNIPHKRVFIFGGKPDWVNTKNVIYVPISQTRGNKWDNTAYNLLQVCLNEEVSDEFILFNDDFYVLKKIDTLDYYYDRTLASRRADFFARMPIYRFKTNGYTGRLLQAERALLKDNLPTRNYELHIPMIFHKRRLAEIIQSYNNIGAKRSLYGNLYAKNPFPTTDVKIWEVQGKPGTKDIFLSTSDRSFIDGEVGKYIRNKFKIKCKYEVNDGE